MTQQQSAASRRTPLSACCLAVLLVACQKAVDELPRVSVNLTAPKTAYSIPTIVAISKGFFSEQHLDVRINYVNTGKLAMDDLLGGNANFANVVETNVAFAGYQSPHIEVIAEIERVYDAAIVARKDKGISTERDLKGKRVGVMLATTSQVFADRMLAKHAIDRGSVTIVHLLPSAMQAAIVEGSTISAISTWQPYVFNVQRALGDKAITFVDSTIFTGHMTLAADSAYIATNPSVVGRMFAAYARAEKFIQDSTASSQAIVGAQLGLDSATVRAIWNEYDFHLRLGKELLDATRVEGEWIRTTQPGFSDKLLPDYSRYFNTAPLRLFDTRRVTW